MPNGPTAEGRADVGFPRRLAVGKRSCSDAALSLAETSEATGTPVLVGHHRRHNPIIGKARDLVRSGDLGRLLAVSHGWRAIPPSHPVAL